MASRKVGGREGWVGGGKGARERGGTPGVGPKFSNGERWRVEKESGIEKES